MTTVSYSLHEEKYPEELEADLNRFIAVFGSLILFLGIVMGLAQGFIAYLPYSIYFGAVVAVLVGAGLYAIYKLDKTTHED